MLVSDLPAPVTASKADWLIADTWLGFSPTDASLTARNQCQSIIQRQFGKGYVLEYITEQFSNPNPGFERTAEYLEERRNHKAYAGRLVAVHKLRTSSRPLEEIIGRKEYEQMQDMWAADGRRYRWSVAFPIVESYAIRGMPKARDVLGEVAYRRLYAHASAILRPLNHEEQELISSLELVPRYTANAWIGIEDEFHLAEMSEVNPQTLAHIDTDLAGALEGMTEERRVKLRRRASWIADRFINERRQAGALICDECGFDPTTVIDPSLAKSPSGKLLNPLNHL